MSTEFVALLNSNTCRNFFEPNICKSWFGDSKKRDINKNKQKQNNPTHSFANSFTESITQSKYLTFGYMLLVINSNTK